MVYAFLISRVDGAGNVATGCWIDINVTGQRKKNTLALKNSLPP